MIVAINKIDQATEENIEFIKNDFISRVKKFRFKSVDFISISAFNGIGIDKLMGTIASIKIEDKKEKIFNINNSNKNIIKTKIMFDHIPSLISAGFSCIAHSKDIYFNIELANINNDKKNYITKNDLNKLIDVEIKILDDITELASNLILRLNDVTVGLARVLDVI